MRAARVLGAVVVCCLGGLAEDGRPTPTLLEYTLRESAAIVESQLGPRTHSARGKGYSVLEFGEDSSEHNDLGYEWTFYFEQPSGELLSIAHYLPEPRSVAIFFPQGETQFHRQESGVSAISRLLPGDRILIAIGMARRDSPCSQIILMRRSAVERFYPWIAAELK